MPVETTPTRHCEKRPGPRKETGRPETDSRAGEDTGRSEALVCARCGAGITSKRERTEVGGQHEHYFVNPHGYDFHIGCFGHAPGAVAAGRTTSEWTWFPGYTWQLDHCASCTAHIGWMFRSRAHEFHGLILARLAESDQPGN